MSKPKPLTTLNQTVAVSAGSGVTLSNLSDTTSDSYVTLNTMASSSSQLDIHDFYKQMLDNIPEDVLKEYYLRKYTKLGRKLNGEE